MEIALAYLAGLLTPLILFGILISIPKPLRLRIAARLYAWGDTLEAKSKR